MDLSVLLDLAHRLGATGATVLATAEIVITPSLAARCREPRCENYGQGKSCPPHVAGPEALQQLLGSYRQAIFFKIDVPSEVLFSSDSREVFQLLHEVAAGLELQAKAMGNTSAMALAGGSCKAIFCPEDSECQALTPGGECRHPQSARPSMSGFGIDVGQLFATAGWQMNWVTDHADSTPTKMMNVCGLVLVR